MFSSRLNVKQKKPNGFSLIEILVAMVIAALLLGMILPNINFSSDQQVKDEAFRLLKIIEMVRDKAVIENREYGLSIDETGYEFLVLNDDDLDKPSYWEKIADLPALNRHDFPEEVEINLAVDGDNIFADREDDVEIFEEAVDIFEEEDEEEKVEPPAIYFLSSGEQNQYTVAFAKAENSSDEENMFYRIQGNIAGDLVYQGPLPGNLYNDIERDYSDYLERP